MKKITFFTLTLLVFFGIGLQTTPAQIIFEHGDSVSFSGVFAGRQYTACLRIIRWHGEAMGCSDPYKCRYIRGACRWSSVCRFFTHGMLLAAGAADDTVKLWDVETQQNIATLEGHAVGGTLVAFSPDGTTLAAGASDGIIKLWNVRDSSEYRYIWGLRCYYG